MDRRQFIVGTAAAAIGGLARGAKAGKPDSAPLRIAHLCDPQFGFITANPAMKWRAAAYSAKNRTADLARCERALERINVLKPDLVLFGGDMVQDPGDLEKEWPSLLKRLNVPFMITPGNHDLGNNVTRENLDRFRRVFGRDYEARDVKGWRIIAGNSQLWHPTDLKDEQARYEKWVAGELGRAEERNGKIILATHIPPFQFTDAEGGSYHNCPLRLRKSRLEAYERAGVRFYLTAHLHRLLMRGWKNLTLLGPETTSENFDGRPAGFRLLEVADDFSYSWDFVAV